jgi:sulfur relay (sulfurtransferase) DsrF/TusC family protein
MNKYPDMTAGTANKIAEDYAIFTITQTEEPDVNKIPQETRDAVALFISSEPAIVDLRALIPVTPLTKAAVISSPGSILPVFRYILRSFESMTYFYHREHLEKTVSSIDNTMTFGKNLNKIIAWTVAHLEMMKASVDMLQTSVESDQLYFTNDDVTHFLNNLVTQAQMFSKYVEISLVHFTHFSGSVKKLCKLAKYSPSASDSTLEKMKNLEAFSTENKNWKKYIQQSKSQLVEAIEKSGTVINSQNATYQMKVQSVTDIYDCFIIDSSTLSSFGQRIEPLLTEICPLAEQDLNTFLSSVEVVLPPKLGDNPTAPVVFETPSVNTPIPTAINIMTSNIARLPRLFSLFPCPSLKWRFVTMNATNIN